MAARAHFCRTQRPLGRALPVRHATINTAYASITIEIVAIVLLRIVSLRAIIDKICPVSPLLDN